MANKTRYISPDVRKEVLESSDECFYCQSKYHPFVIDHVAAFRATGDNSRENLVKACCICNSSKSGFTLSEWLIRCNSKRDFIASKTYGYCYHLRKARKRNHPPERILDLEVRIMDNRMLHSKLTRIISKLNYLLNG